MKLSMKSHRTFYIGALLYSVAFASICAEENISKIPWPKVIIDFPLEENTNIKSGIYEISWDEPKDPEIQMGGGSGGHIVKIKIKDLKHDWQGLLVTQSVGRRLLETFKGKPQIENWGRGGGGYYTRQLFRYTGKEFSLVRIDEFETNPRHDNASATTTLPPWLGNGDAPLYFIETRIPR